jgi:hypothetical protein
MRRWLVVGTVIGATLALPLDAAADGGAYIELDRTHYLPGETAVGIGYAAIPEARQDLFERGPFYVYVVPNREWIQEGRPLPDGVIRVGTATIERDSGTTFRIGVSFTVPYVTGDYYNLQLCNDPCTIAGFREPLSAWMSIVQTPREAQLLNEQDELQRKNWSLRRQVRKANGANEELAASLEIGRDSLSELSAEVSRLERELETALAHSDASAAATAEGDGRPLADAWVLFGLGVALILGFASIGLAIVFGQRRLPEFVVVPDTIEELEEPELAEITRP